MLKKIIFLTILFVFLFFVPGITYGQGISDNVPGLTCGIPGDITGKDKCCSIQTGFKCDHPVLTTLQGFLNFIPGVGGMVNDYLQKCSGVENFVKQNNDTACIVGDPSTTNFSDPSCKCVDPNSNTNSNTNVNTAIVEMCYKYLSSSTLANDLAGCLRCSSQNGMWTGMGCLSLDLGTLIGGFVLTSGIGIGGGFALLCIIYAAFMMQSSEGNPEKLKKAQEMITSCIMGLMLIIFSIFIMKLIGVNILKIPGFG
ncbi:MAG: hypothetical protein WC741_01735 [Patescibacteria group bacterium]|jgi:hypothetical protein